jgi:hypothetical protein
MGPQITRSDELGDQTGQLSPVTGRERLPETTRDRQEHVGPCIGQPTQHPPDERRVQEGHVRGAHERDLGVVSHRREPGGDALHRPQPFDRIRHHQHTGREFGQFLAGRGDHHDRAVHGPAE